MMLNQSRTSRITQTRHLFGLGVVKKLLADAEIAVRACERLSGRYLFVSFSAGRVFTLGNCFPTLLRDFV